MKIVSIKDERDKDLQMKDSSTQTDQEEFYTQITNKPKIGFGESSLDDVPHIKEQDNRRKRRKPPPGVPIHKPIK